MFEGVYSGKRVLITGHTGFKGSWLCAWLLRLGAEVAGFSIGVPSEPSNFKVLGLRGKIKHYEGDIRDFKSLAKVFDAFKPEVVFHLAAQAIVRRSYDDPVLTFETNTLGTMNILECLRQRPTVRAAVIITSDKCYKNVGWTWGYRENDMLGGDDPYSASKACAELICASYIKSYLDKGTPMVGTTRAGNVIGGGDWAPDRIVPDCVRAWSDKKPVFVRYPHATRPWQHVLEPLSGYLWLGAMLWNGDPKAVGESFNFGPPADVNQSVEELIKVMAQNWTGNSWETNSSGATQRNEASLLKLSGDKALNKLGWYATFSFSDTVRFTSDWYRRYYENGSKLMYDLTLQQIEEYSEKAREKGLLWASV